MSLKLNSSGGGSVSLTEPVTASNFTLDLPAVSDTILTRTTNIVSGTSVASTSGTSIDFTSIPSLVKRVTVLFQGISTSGVSNPIIQLGTSSGVITSGYTGVVNFYSQGSSSAGFALSDGFRIVQNNAAGLFYGMATFCNISGNTWVGSLNVCASGSGYASHANGFIALSATLDRVRITMQNGTDTFDAGTINILYE